MVAIIDDPLLEKKENFTINIRKSPDLGNRFTIQPTAQVINITDNDSA